MPVSFAAIWRLIAGDATACRHRIGLRDQLGTRSGPYFPPLARFPNRARRAILAAVTPPASAPPPPDAALLHEAALAHLARFASSAAGLARVLERRIARWQREAAVTGEAATVEQQGAAARLAAREVVARLVAAGVIDDAAFAATRAARLNRAGRSRRGIAAHLAARGIAGKTLRAALPENPEAELAAALALARRRRLGPFHPSPPTTGAPDASETRRALAILARAGFSRAIAEAALAMAPAQAEALVLRLLRG